MNINSTWLSLTKFCSVQINKLYILIREIYTKTFSSFRIKKKHNHVKYFCSLSVKHVDFVTYQSK